MSESIKMILKKDMTALFLLFVAVVLVHGQSDLDNTVICSPGEYAHTPTTCRRQPLDGFWSKTTRELFPPGPFPYSNSYNNPPQKNDTRKLLISPLIIYDVLNGTINSDAILVHSSTVVALLYNRGATTPIQDPNNGCGILDEDTNTFISTIYLPCLTMLKFGTPELQPSDANNVPLYQIRKVNDYCDAWMINTYDDNTNNLLQVLRTATSENVGRRLVDVGDTVDDGDPNFGPRDDCGYTFLQRPRYWLTDEFESLSDVATSGLTAGRNVINSDTRDLETLDIFKSNELSVTTPGHSYNQDRHTSHAIFTLNYLPLSETSGALVRMTANCEDKTCRDFIADQGEDWPVSDQSRDRYDGLSWPLYYNDVTRRVGVKFFGSAMNAVDDICRRGAKSAFVDDDRGCAGYGICPIGANATKACSGHGTCTVSGKCLCDKKWAGVACDKPIPDDFLYYNATCAEAETFDVCSGHGTCTEVEETFNHADTNVNDTVHRTIRCICTNHWVGNDIDHVPLYVSGLYQFGQANQYHYTQNGDITLAGQTQSVYEYIKNHQCIFWLWLQSDDFIGEGNITDASDFLPMTAFRQPVWVEKTHPEYNPGEPVGYQCRKGYVRNEFWQCVKCPNCSSHGTCKLHPREADTHNATYCECDFNWQGALCDVTTCPCATNDNGDCSPNNICSGELRGQCVDPSTTLGTFNSSYAKACSCFDGFGAPDENTVNFCQTAYCGTVGDWSCSNMIKIDKSTGANVFAKHGSCINGSCVCEKSSIDGTEVGYVGTNCETKACPMSHDGIQCNCGKIGSIVENCETSVCDGSSLKCDCLKTWQNKAPADISTANQRFWGTACQHTFGESCIRNGEFCAGHGHDCVPSNRSDPLEAPKCVCNKGYSGDFCEIDLCPGGHRCNARIFGKIEPANGICRHYCTNSHELSSLCTSAGSYDPTYNFSLCDCRGFANSFWAGPACAVPAPACFSENYHSSDPDSGLPCSGHGRCELNALSGEYQCICDSAYNTTNPAQPCGNREACAGNCTGVGQICVPIHANREHKCECRSPYIQIGGDFGTCVDRCTATGGTLTNNNNTCLCPEGSVWFPHSEEDAASYDFKGCRKLCPSFRGRECGSRETRNTGGHTRCIPIEATNTTANATCACNFHGKAFVPALDVNATMLYVDSTTVNGSCEPYCLNCVCEDSACSQCNNFGTSYSGDRCDTLACNGRGILNLDAQCFNCTPSTIYSGDNCEIDVCEPGGTYDPTTQTCKCKPNTLYTLEVSTASLEYETQSTRKCVHQCQHNSTISADGTECENCPEIFTGTHCESPLCVHGQPSADNQTCVCNFPQFNSTFCNVSLCENGGTPKVHMEGCHCPKFYDSRDGFCNVDLCDNGNGHASADGSYCECDPGYSNETIAGRCTKNKCNPGNIVPCDYDASTCPFNYTCACGSAFSYESSNGTCVQTENDVCVNGVWESHPTEITRCVCQAGFEGTDCATPKCSDNELLRYDAAADACRCIEPYMNVEGGCNETWCGPHEASPPTCTRFGENNTIAGCFCTCKTGFIQRLVAYANKTRPCVLHCAHLLSNDSFYLPQEFGRTILQGKKIPPDINFTDSDISTSQCQCKENFTGIHCLRNINTVTVDDSSSSFPEWAYFVIGGLVVALAFTIAMTVHCYKNKDCCWKTDYSKV